MMKLSITGKSQIKTEESRLLEQMKAGLDRIELTIQKPIHGI